MTTSDRGNPAENGRDSGELAEAAESPSGSDSVLENFLSLGSGIVISRAIAFIGTTYLARRLGVYGFGVIGFATAVCSYFALALRTGFGPMVTREVARHPERIPPMASAVMVAVLVWLGPQASWLLRLASGTVIYGATLALIRGIPADARP